MASPKTALVLSAGGLFGAYQVGAWKHLQTCLQPDLIIGASIGALNGWVIAGGRGSGLEEMWLDAPVAGMIRRLARPSLRHGYYDAEPIRRHMQTIAAIGLPAIPYWLVLIELPGLRTRLIPAAEVTAEHLLATCSIPLLLPKVRIGGRSYTDGGMLGHLPLWAAAELGAARIVAVDCLPRISPWWLQAAMSGMHSLGPKRRLPSDVRILRPSEHLGGRDVAMTYDRALVRQWIDLGERDARRAFPSPAN